MDNPKAMAGPAFVPVAEAVCYTANAPGLTAAIVKQVTIVNTSAVSSVAVGISILRGGAAAGQTNRVVPDSLTLEPGAVVTLDVAWVLNNGETLSWKASLANVASCTISGIERIA